MEKYDITLEELKQKQLDGAEVIDVRNKREYEEGHIEGSINVPEYEINEDFKNIIINKNIKKVLSDDNVMYGIVFLAIILLLIIFGYKRNSKKEDE
jgi:rhodanese-related sulfurtransferase